MEVLLAPENLGNLISQLGSTVVAVLVLMYFLKRMMPDQSQVVEALAGIRQEIRDLREDVKDMNRDVIENRERLIKVESKVGL